ncbi:rhomboid family intramembrane serine protease [Singulisphaera sp. PoT]|uniref:rhomboid family intramembrane serine protease n=1 Tax=Singulisphaera sp. PoT TaxID=3411797 RepID=UPI003BF49085
MGISDREYYRDETSGSGWFSGVAPACKTIILINVIVFLLTNSNAHSPLERMLEARSFEIFRQGHVWQLLTATFLHANFSHILWNMLFLWFVGREMESFYGTINFTALYLSAGIISTLGWAIADYFLISHYVQHFPMVGASGAVMSIVVLYALYYPHREMLLFFVLPVQTWLVVVLFLSRDAWEFLTRGSMGGPGTAVAAHLTGATYGYLYKHFDLRWTRLISGRVGRPKLRVIMPEPREKPSVRQSGPTWSPDPATASKPSGTAVVTEEQLDARLDEVLAKIAREGRGKLTEEENRFLQEASRRAQNRRSDRI